MTTILCIAQPDGSLGMSDYQRSTMRQFIKESAGKRIRLTLQKMTPESREQRGFLHGGVYTLWAYLDGNDYKGSSVVKRYHEYAKLEFNPEIVVIGGKVQKIGKSTKGDLTKFIEKIVDYLVENYGIDPHFVLNPTHYKHFRDTIWPFTTKYDTYIDYLVDIGNLK